MSERWKYGNYEFRINPSSLDSSYEMVGDNVRTLTGALISQPTVMTESFSISTIFYQPRTRIISDAILLDVICFEIYNGLLYAVNKVQDKINVYNNNFVLVKSIPLSNVSNKNYRAVDITSSGIWIISEGTSDYSLYKINESDGTLNSATKTIAVTNALEVLGGIKELNGTLFLLRDSSIDHYSLPSITRVKTVTLPSVGYAGLSSDGTYLLVGQLDDYSNNVIYHVNQATGAILNSIYNEGIGRIQDVSYDGKYFCTLINGIYKVQKIEGNTTLLDIYNLETEIEGTRFVVITDDMGVDRRVRVDSISKQRRPQNETAFDVSMRITKINRG